MSVEAARRALNWRGGTPVERHVLVVVGIATDHHRDWARLTLDELADLTGYARGSVTKIVRRLIDAGALVRRGSGGRHPSEYQVHRARTDAPAASVEPTPNRRPTDAEPTPAERQERMHRDRDRDRERQTPPTPPPVVEVVHPERSPATAPDGAGGELAAGLRLDELIADVRARRQPTLTRGQARQARPIARDRLAAGWDPRLVVAALVECSAFTDAAFDFAVDQLRRPGSRAGVAANDQVAARRIAARARGEIK